MDDDEISLANELRSHCIPHGNKYKEHDPEKSAKVLHRMGLLYWHRYNPEDNPDKFCLIRSAGLFKAALLRKPSNEKTIEKDLQGLCTFTLKTAGAFDTDADLLCIAKRSKHIALMMRDHVEKLLKNMEKMPWLSCVDQSNKHKRKVTKQRQRKVKQVQKLMKDITKMYKFLMKYISDMCIEIMGEPPCVYSVFGMGSLARGEVTPYSDFEHGIVLQEWVANLPRDEKEKILNFFRWFSVIFHLVGYAWVKQ